jgi:hypothetical protein
MVSFLFIRKNFRPYTPHIFIPRKRYSAPVCERIVPLYNPHIFAGIPFLFDPGMGHLHPLNLFFVLPYPFSFSLWVGATTLLYLGGFYLFFRKSSSSPEMSLIFSLILFFSGSGFLRISNPTIFAVIAHYGLFLYSLSSLKGNKKDMLFPFVAGVLMTLSGHLQFVVYGYILGFITALFHFRHSISRTLSILPVAPGSLISLVILLLGYIGLESLHLSGGGYGIGPIDRSLAPACAAVPLPCRTERFCGNRGTRFASFPFGYSVSLAILMAGFRLVYFYLHAVFIVSWIHEIPFFRGLRVRYGCY